MSERAENEAMAMALLCRMELVECGDDQGMARAICQHLGLTWEMADDVRDAYNFEPNWPTFPRLADAIATLLEAAGVEP